MTRWTLARARATDALSGAVLLGAVVITGTTVVMCGLPWWVAFMTCDAALFVFLLHDAARAGRRNGEAKIGGCALPVTTPTMGPISPPEMQATATSLSRTQMPPPP